MTHIEFGAACMAAYFESEPAEREEWDRLMVELNEATDG